MSSKILGHFLTTNLDELKVKGLFNDIDPLESSNGPIIAIN
jgi:glycine C-acetyltransferase